MIQILLGAANIMVLIICLMGMQTCYFRSNWKWFWLLLFCVVVSAGCAAVEFYQWLGPDTPFSMPRLDRSLVNPL